MYNFSAWHLTNQYLPSQAITAIVQPASAWHLANQCPPPQAKTVIVQPIGAWHFLSGLRILQE